MPLDEYAWLGRSELLSFEEIERLAAIFLGLGVEKIRLTGGEPLLRKNLEGLVSRLAALEGLKDLALTTNGAGLEQRAGALRGAGLNRINISLDSLRPDRFAIITQRGRLEDVLAGISAAKKVGLDPVKINAVIQRGVNEDEIIDLVEFAAAQGLGIRFIEYMDVGNANAWNLDKTVSEAEILQKVRAHYRIPGGEGTQGSGRRDMLQATRQERERARAPAIDYSLVGAQGQRSGASVDLGVIASVTQPFCSSCSRARLTADGKLVTCLFAGVGHDLKTPLREGASDAELRARIVEIWNARSDRFSEQRLGAIHDGKGYRPDDFRKIEMITLGG